MRLRLYVSQNENARDYSSGRRFRFAVVDLDRGKDYPANFVCMLPLSVGSNGKALNRFMSVFGGDSVETAKKLLVDALEREDNVAVRDEIERRLKLLEPKPVGEAVCVSCGRRFQTKSGRWSRRRFCQECMKKKFADRE